jgi:hypothetical protein
MVISHVFRFAFFVLRWRYRLSVIGSERVFCEKPITNTDNPKTQNEKRIAEFDCNPGRERGT